MNRYCNLTGVGIIPWGPLDGGKLARPVKDQNTLRAKGEIVEEKDAIIINRVEETAKKKGWKMSQVALAWINSRVTSPIVGFSSIARMEEALSVAGLKLTAEEEEYLHDLYEPRKLKAHAMAY